MPFRLALPAARGLLQRLPVHPQRLPEPDPGDPQLAADDAEDRRHGGEGYGQVSTRLPLEGKT